MLRSMGSQGVGHDSVTGRQACFHHLALVKMLLWTWVCRCLSHRCFTSLGDRTWLAVAGADGHSVFHISFIGPRRVLTVAGGLLVTACGL